MSWHVELSKSAIKELKGIPASFALRVERSIDEMEKDPFAGDVKPLKGKDWHTYYRKRVGQYRIIFAVKKDERRVEIASILIRSEKTYRR
jgi:mRNA-degrading endonuclease RelE of RelBE toxin-antitoxin system